MWRPRKFKYIYLMATLYVFTLTIPSAASVYWAFGDELLTHANAFSLFPSSPWRDAAVILMLIHQVGPRILRSANFLMTKKYRFIDPDISMRPNLYHVIELFFEEYTHTT